MQVQPTKTGDFVTPTKEELLAYQFKEEVMEYVSPNTQIKYRFTRYVNNGRTMIFIPLIIQGQDAKPVRLYVNSSTYQRQDANGALVAINDSELIVSQRPDLDLAKYPDANTPGTRQLTPGMEAFISAGYAVVAPKWCIVALFLLEANPSQLKRNQFTTVLSEKVPGANGVLSRAQKDFVNLRDLKDPEIVAALAMTGQQTIIDGGQSKTVDVSYTGQQLIENDAYRNNYLKVVTLTPTPSISNVLIGRPFCIDLISEFVVPSGTLAPKEFPAAPGFQPPPVAQPTTQPPSGFQPLPGPAVPERMQVELPVAELSAKINSRIEEFLLRSSCQKSSKDMRRLDTAVSRITGQIKVGFEGFRGKYLNLSTCQLAMAQGKSIIKRSMGLIPGTNQNLNLAITQDDIAVTILDMNIDNVFSPANVAVMTPTVNAIFKKAEQMIFDRLGTITKHAVGDASAVPVSILDALPSGPRPVQRPIVVPKTPFVDTATFEGVIEYTTPITDNKKCLPGLMAKKRD
jgi:hypothetical protein